MRLLFIGDIVGKPGRRIVSGLLPQLKKELSIDVVIANFENLAHGKGINESSVQEMIAAGVDIGTGGDHIFEKPQAEELFKKEPNMFVRPLNLDDAPAGEGSKTFNLGQKKVTVVNLLGQFGMARPPVESPFEAMQKWIDRKPATDIIIVDVHAEATSEKVNMGWWLDGKVTAVLGTHTHVRTADERILPGGTAYITDVGMTGLRDSSLGIDKDITVQKFVTGQHVVHEIPEQGIAMINGVLIDIDEHGRSTSIERIYKELQLS